MIDDQPPPNQDATGPDVWLLVLADMEDRRQLGIARYGVPVRPDNGRDHLWDVYAEILDAAVYIRSEIEKRGTAMSDSIRSVEPSARRVFIVQRGGMLAEASFEKVEKKIRDRFGLDAIVLPNGCEPVFV